ncbi:MAG: PD40 domain-containing protein [Thaumarchaeota archaeon]|nr:PD40 domain-containing protein [Nitrososphaerota archaeon]
MKTLHYSIIGVFVLFISGMMFYGSVYAAYVGPDCNEKDVVGFSPVTSKVAFVSNEGSANPDNFTLYAINSDGTGDLAKISQVAFQTSSIIISPDGKKIVFSYNLNGTNSLFISNIDGTGLQQLTNFTASAIGFFPNSTKIIFGKNLHDVTGFSNIYSINIDGTDVFSITHDSQEKFWTAASANGKIIAYSTETGIYTDKVFAVNTDGTNLHFVTDGSLFSYEKPVISDNGTKIIFSRYTDTLDYLYVINADGTGLVKLGPLNQPSISDNFIMTHDRSMTYYWPILRVDSSTMIFPERINGTMQIFVSHDNGKNVMPIVDNSYFTKNPDCTIPSDLAQSVNLKTDSTSKITPQQIHPANNTLSTLQSQLDTEHAQTEVRQEAERNEKDASNAIVLAEIGIPITASVSFAIFIFSRKK